MKADIVVVGSLNMDLVVFASRHPKIGETLLGKDFRTFPGGKGANQAVAAARLGASVAMVGCVGADTFGGLLMEALRTEGVNTDHVRRDPSASTGVALITVNDAGDNTIVVVPGANDRITSEDVLEAEGTIKDAAVLLTQLESPPDVVASTVKLARRLGTKVVLNPAPARTIEPGVLASVDYLIPNESELRQLVPGQELQEGVARLRELGARQVVVTLGEQGVLVAGATDMRLVPAHHVEVVDTTAAGDAFVGAFAVALVEGRSLLEAAEWANAAGAIAVGRVGAQPSLPSRGDLEALLAKCS